MCILNFSNTKGVIREFTVSENLGKVTTKLLNLYEIRPNRISQISQTCTHRFHTAYIIVSCRKIPVHMYHARKQEVGSRGVTFWHLMLNI